MLFDVGYFHFFSFPQISRKTSISRYIVVSLEIYLETAFRYWVLSQERDESRLGTIMDGSASLRLPFRFLQSLWHRGQDFRSTGSKRVRGNPQAKSLKEKSTLRCSLSQKKLWPTCCKNPKEDSIKSKGGICGAAGISWWALF